MLVPFELNEEKIAELNIPRFVADWHRVRILKEIDDIRYQASTFANIDLTGESMVSLKKLKLFSLFNPVIDYNLDSNGNPNIPYIKSYDNIVEAYDIPIEWYLKATYDLVSFLKRNRVNVTPDALIRYIKDDALKVVTNFQGTKCFFFFLRAPIRYLGTTPITTAEEQAQYLAKFKDAAFSAFNFMDYSGNFDFTNESNINFWNFQKYLKAGQDCLPLYYSPTYSDFLLDRSSGTPVITDINVSDVNVYYFKYFFDYQGYRDTSAYGTKFYPPSSLGGDFYFFNPGVSSVPEILKLETVLGYISSSIMHFAPLSKTVDILERATIKSVVDRNIPVVIEEPNPSYLRSSPGELTLASYDSRAYTITLTSSTPSFYQYYKTCNVTLENGKAYYLPFDTFKYKDPFGTTYIYSSSTYTNVNFALARSYISAGAVDEAYLTRITTLDYSNNAIEDVKPSLKFVYDKNVPQFSFPGYFPRMLLFNVNRIRNGLLYSDASKFYQLEFIKYPDVTLDKIDNLIFQQEAIEELYTDIKSKFYFYETRYDSVLKNTVYDWFYYDNGIKMPFLHPVTQKPVSGIRFLYEMIFEMVVLWGEIQKEINTFLEQRKFQNESAFNQAYQNYLRGQATINGPEALALFEEKLKTGIFYIENGFEYWRKFTTLEVTLIEKFKSNAYQNAEIEKQNIEIRKLNEKYQYEANLPILLANEKILSEARLMAMPEMKKIADEQLSKIVPPTIDYLINRAETEGGFPTDILNKWVQENPFYYIRPDLRSTVENLLEELTLREQQIATSLAAEAISEVKFTKALQDIFEIKG